MPNQGEGFNAAQIPRILNSNHFVVATNSINQNLTNGAFTVINFDTISTQHNGNQGIPIFSIATQVFTIRSHGIYWLGLSVALAASVVGIRELGIRKNTLTVASLDDNPINLIHQMTYATVVECQVGDTIDFVAFQNSGGLLALTAASNSPLAQILELFRLP